MSMATDSAHLILRLYELRREPLLRQARGWFGTEFNPTTYEEFNESISGEHNAWFRMVVSYWDMAASMVLLKAIDREMFNASNGELLGVYAKLEPFLEQIRTEFNEPEYLKHLERVARRFPDAEARIARARERIRAMAQGAKSS